jgi:aminoglycoside phosphotransferase (APT) family kinase protein
MTVTTPPPDDAERALLADLGARHGLWPPETDPVALARGSENVTFAVGGCIARFSGDGEALAREVALLQALAGKSTVATPVPLVHDGGLGLMVYRTLPGRPLLHRRGHDDVLIATALTDVLRALRTHADPAMLPLDDYADEEWHHDAVENFEAVRSELDDARAATVSAFLAEAPPARSRPWAAQHNDLGAEHILVDEAGRVTAVIDWTDAAYADPACDLALLYRDLGAGVAFRVGEALDGPLSASDRKRIRFHARCKLLEDLRFGLEEPETRAPYLANALGTFDRTFAVGD